MNEMNKNEKKKNVTQYKEYEKKKKKQRKEIEYFGWVVNIGRKINSINHSINLNFPGYMCRDVEIIIMLLCYALANLTIYIRSFYPSYNFLRVYMIYPTIKVT